MTRWCTVATGLVLALAGAGTPSASSAAPADLRSQAQAVKTTRLTLAASADEVDYGARVTLSGKLTAGGKGIRGQKVVLKLRVGASRTWTKLGPVTTSRRGTWKKVVEARVHTTYMAVYKGTQTYAPSKAPRSEVAVAAPLTDVGVTPGNRDAYKDEIWTWTGRTAPELAGRRVSLVRGPFRASTTVRTATIGPGGAISLTHQMSDVGSYEYWLNVNGSALMYGRDSARTLIRTRREGAPTAPSIATTSLPSVEVHVPYQFSLVGGGGELVWSVVGGTFPPGLSLDPSGLITGNPSATGSWSFTVQAANPVGAHTRTLELTSLPGTLTVTTYPLYDAAVGSSYPDAPYSSGGWQEMFCVPCPEGANWRVTSGTLPPGMGFGTDEFVDPPASYVYGRPTHEGLYEFTVTAVAGERSGSKTFSLRVLPGAASLLRIDYDVVTLSIPNGVLGQPYSHQFEAAGASDLAWSAFTPLPPGLTLSPSGLLHGVPTMTGTGWIDVAATDGTRYDWQGFGFTVQAPP